eukprot:s10_g3.t1
MARTKHGRGCPGCLGLMRLRKAMTNASSCVLSPLQKGLAQTAARPRGNATNATTASLTADISWIQVLALLQDGQQHRLQAHVTLMNRLAATEWPRSLQIFGQDLDLIAKNAMLAALAVQQLWRQSLEFLQAMEEKDVISRSSTMDACGKASRWQVAVNQGVTGGKRGMRVDTPFFNVKLGALEKGQQWMPVCKLWCCCVLSNVEI